MNTNNLSIDPPDKNYLLRLLNGNTEMMGIVLNEIYQNLPTCITEIDASLKTNDSLGVVTYAARAKSALLLIKKDKLALAFLNIEESARKGEMTLAKNTFNSTFYSTQTFISDIKEFV